jgi:hypothetical protein
LDLHNTPVPCCAGQSGGEGGGEKGAHRPRGSGGGDGTQAAEERGWAAPRGRRFEKGDGDRGPAPDPISRPEASGPSILDSLPSRSIGHPHPKTRPLQKRRKFLQKHTCISIHVSVVCGDMPRLGFNVAAGVPISVPIGAPIGVPVGVPIGVPIGVPVGVPAGVPAGVPIGSSSPNVFIIRRMVV